MSKRNGLIMAFNSKLRIRAGYATAFLFLSFSYALLFYSTWQTRRYMQWVSHTYIVLAQAEALKASIAEAETGARGFILTKDEKFLAPYLRSLESIPSNYKALKNLTADNFVQQARLDTIDRLLQKRLFMFEFGLQRFRESNFTITREMEVNWQNSRITTDSIRDYIDRMRNTERELLDQRRKKLAGISGNLQVLIILSLLSALIAVFYSLLLYSKENKKADQYQMELEASIRRLKSINEELVELRSMEKFAATGRIARTIAHEVRNPLTNISLAGEQLGSLSVQTPEAKQLLEMINRNSQRINQMVADLLDATKTVQLDIRKVDLNELIEETLELASDRIELNQIRIEKNLLAKGCLIAADREKMCMAFLNIVVNAIEAMEKGRGILTINTKTSADKCIVEIIDNGKGISPEMIGKIFEPYFTGKQKGNGLGLTNTQNIILSHKGNIKVESEPGKGSIFTVTLEKA